MDEFFFEAIVSNKFQFLKLFLENGFVIKNFLTYRKLLKLYNQVNYTIFHLESFTVL